MTPPRASISWLIRHASLLHRNWIRFFEKLTADYGDIVYFELPGIPLCMINEPGYVETVLVCDPGNSIKSKNYRALARLLGNGLIVSDGKFWRQQRRLIQPAFHHDAIVGHLDLMTARVERMLDGWQQGEVLDVHQEMTELTLSIASDAFLGKNMEDSARALTSVLYTLMEQYAGLGIYLVPAWVPTPNNLRARMNVRKVDGVIADVIRDRKASSDQRMDVLSMLLSSLDEAGQPLSSRQLRDEVVTLFLAGHETTANALSWTWYLLARHPEVETRLLSEIRDVLGDRPPAVTDLAQLRYTNLVIKESMRLYPPVGGIGRETITKLELGMYTVPPRTNIFMSQWLMHRNQRFFDEPEAFKPERWTAEFERQLPPFAYFPFGGGPRLCIGASFAVTEMIVLVAAIARRFRLRLLSERPIDPVFSISLRPGGGIKMLVEARK